MRKLKAALISAATTFSLAAIASPQEHYRERIAALRDIKDLQRPLPEPVSPPKACTKATVDNGNHLVRSERSNRIEATLADFAVYNPNRTVLWPGALVRWSSLEGGNPALINVPRAPIDIWIDASHSTKVRKLGVEPTAGAITTAINELLLANPDGYAFRGEFKYAELHSIEQAALQLNLSAEWLTGSAKASLSTKKRLENHVVVAQFTQIYYSAMLDLPNAGNQALFGDLGEAAINATFAPNDPPLYISQVNYGRRLLFKIESESKFSEVKAALQVANKFALGEVSASVAQSSLDLLSKTEVQLIAVGGDPDAAAKVISTQNFLEYINNGTRPSSKSPGVPISYTVLQLKDNTTAAFKRAENFDVVDYSQRVKQVRIVIEKIKVHNDGDDWPRRCGRLHVEVQGERPGVRGAHAADGNRLR